MIKAFYLSAIIAVFCISCNEAVNVSTDAAVSDTVRGVKSPAEIAAIDTLVKKKIEEIGGLTRIYDELGNCKGKEFYSPTKKSIKEEDLRFLAEKLAVLGMTKTGCAPVKSYFAVYIYKKNADPQKDRYMARCIISGTDEPQVDLLKKP